MLYRIVLYRIVSYSIVSTALTTSSHHRETVEEIRAGPGGGLALSRVGRRGGAMRISGEFRWAVLDVGRDE